MCEGTAEAFLSELEAVVFGEDEGRRASECWQHLHAAKPSRKLVGRLLPLAGATLFTCVPVSEGARAGANLSDGSAIRGSGDRRGLVVPALRSSVLIESRQQAADAAVLAAVPWASVESKKIAKNCLETWLTECGNEPSNPKQKARTGGVATASLHELLPQALAAIRAQLPAFNPSSGRSTSLSVSLSVAIVRGLHWLMQQSDYLVLKDRRMDQHSSTRVSRIFPSKASLYGSVRWFLKQSCCRAAVPPRTGPGFAFDSPSPGPDFRSSGPAHRLGCPAFDAGSCPGN